MRSPFHILYLVIFFWPAVCLQAQDSTAFAFESLTTFNELSSNTIQDVTQDDDGFLWIATADGLNRFDGTEVVQFLHDNTPNSIPSNHVSRVLRLPGNKLAIGTTAGLCLYDLHKKIVQNFHYKDSSGLEQYDNFIYRLTTDRDGNIWIGTPSCIIQLSPQLVFKKIFRSSYTRNDIGKVRMNYVQKIVRLSQGRLLFYLISGIKVYEPALDSLVDINDKRNNPLSFLRNTFHWQVFEAGNNQLFILKTGIDSIYLFNEDQNTLRSTGYPHNRYPFVAWELQISKINETRFVISHHEYGFSNLSIVNGTPVLSPVIYSRDIQFGKVFADRQSNWWFINRYGGLLKKIGEQSRFTYFPLYDKRTNQSITLAVNTIKKIDGLFWLSTYGRGIFIYNPVTGQKTQLYLRGLGDEINSNFIWQFYEYSADTLWVGTQKGLLWMHKKKFTYGPLRNYAGKPRELDSFAITTQFEDSHGQLWIGLGAGHGVCVFDKNTQSFRYYKGKDINGYPFRYPLYIAEDSKKRRWFVSDQNSRLLYYDSARDRMIPVDVLTKNINSPIAFTCLSIDKRDVFWIGSNAGLIRFDPATHQSKFYGRHDGLCNSFVEHIYIDETGKLWIGTDGGLSCFDPVKETFSNFYKKYGLPIDIVTGDFYKDIATGLVYTGGTGGFISFNPGGVLKTSPELVKLLITGIQVNSKAYDADPLKLISLSNKEKNLSVSFSAVDLVNGPLSKYSYQLKGSTDTSWINLGRQRQINFSNLAAGAYALSIRSIDEAGNPNSQPVLLHFRIIPPFTQTAWFYLLILLLTAGIFYLLYRYRVKQLMAMEKVRGTISRDLHDEIGANLTNISLLSLLGQKNVADPKQVSGLLTRIYDDSRTVSESMREIVWSINPQNDSLEKTLPNMLRYASEMLEAKGIQLQANLPENIDKIRLDMEQRRDLYLIFKEVINNLAKHSAAGKAFITFRFANGFLYMSAEDDGRGFDTSLPFSSNGIRNMKERAAKQKWKIAINSAPLKGTKIELEAQMA